MQAVATGFATIAVVIAVGWVVAHLRLVDESVQHALITVSFFVATPALVIAVLARSDTHAMLTRPLLATALGVLIPAAGYLIWARRTGRSLAAATIGVFSATYVNSTYLGIPVATYVLGDAAWVTPVLLLQVLLLQPLGLAVLDHTRGSTLRTGAAGANDAPGAHSASAAQPGLRTGALWRSVMRRPLTNPFTIAAVIGLALSLTGTTLPAPVLNPLELIADFAVPGMLLAYGIALRLGPRLGSGVGGEVALTTSIKLVAQPLCAYLAARYLLGISGQALYAVTVTSALPTAQNIFAHAVRYRQGEVLARDTILLTTIGCIPVIAIITALLH